MKKTEEFLLKLLETQSVSGSEAGLAPVLDEFLRRLRIACSATSWAVSYIKKPEG